MSRPVPIRLTCVSADIVANPLGDLCPTNIWRAYFFSEY